MKVIGITGGIGAGKSQILDYIETKYKARILKADLIAHELQQPGQVCYQQLLECFGEKIQNQDGYIDRNKLAEAVFYEEGNLKKVNSIVHPAVKSYIINEIEKEQKRGYYDLFFIEAALLIEDGYEKICGELWYIYADEEIRRKRLAKDRGYSDEKTAAIFGRQLKEADFRKHCGAVIDNSGSLAASFAQIDKKLGGI